MTVAIVTGGESGIGAATAVRLAKSAADVAITYFSNGTAAARTVDLVEAQGRSALAVRCDVGEEADVARLFDAAEALGPVRWLVNSAGVNMTGVTVEKMTLQRFEHTLSVDLAGPFLTCREFVRRVSGEGGRIVNVSSIHERAPRVGGADYGAAKGGLSQFTANLALELAPRGIAVNGIAPGMILTRMNQSAIDSRAELSLKEAAIPWGRAGRPEEVADLAAFLLSEAADYITGTTVTIDGGLSLTLAQGA